IVYNSIVYFNTARDGANYSGWFFNNSCTTPVPASGSGNFDADPQLASAFRLGQGSPCRAAGKPGYAVGADIDGEPWGTPPSMGCDEYYSAGLTGELAVSIFAPYTYLQVNYAAPLTAWIDGRVSIHVWDFGDGILVTNRSYATHAWTEPGDYTVV